MADISEGTFVEEHMKVDDPLSFTVTKLYSFLPRGLSFEDITQKMRKSNFFSSVECRIFVKMPFYWKINTSAATCALCKVSYIFFA